VDPRDLEAIHSQRGESPGFESRVHDVRGAADLAGDDTQIGAGPDQIRAAGSFDGRKWSDEI
jgi:hypothetical protein